MGYDVHITRADDWTESASVPISLEDWLAVVDRDPELRLERTASATTAEREIVSFESPGLSVWTGWSRHGAGGSFAWIDHSDGEIVVKNPDEEVLRKMHQIARALGARVQGDDGEEYDATGRAVLCTLSGTPRELTGGRNPPGPGARATCR